MILIIDNYDSFVHNLARYVQRLGLEVRVVRNDAITPAEVEEAVARREVEAMILSPGPGTPVEAGCCIELIRQFAGRLPILGVCLGHQAIGAAFGAAIVRAPRPIHGRATWIEHSASGLFDGLPQPLRVGRYHSLVVDPVTLPDMLRITARTSDGIVMAIEHREWPVVGWQFHPESVLTERGYDLLAAFLRRAQLEPGPIPADESSDVWWTDALAPPTTWPTYPIRFPAPTSTRTN